MARSISGQISKTSGACPQRPLLLLRAYSIKKILTMSLIHKNDRGEDYNSPEIMIINVATECGFANSTSTKKEYGVGIDPYGYEEDTYL